MENKSAVKVLYARKANEPEYMEELITENEDKFEAAKEWARGQGYTIFRVATIELDKTPNFGGTVTQ